jgi:hypothetical protein
MDIIIAIATILVIGLTFGKLNVLWDERNGR